MESHAAALFRHIVNSLFSFLENLASKLAKYHCLKTQDPQCITVEKDLQCTCTSIGRQGAASRAPGRLIPRVLVQVQGLVPGTGTSTVQVM